MSQIEKLLEIDEENARETRRFFANYSSELPEALDEAAELYRTFSRNRASPRSMCRLAARLHDVGSWTLPRTEVLVIRRRGRATAGGDGKQQ